MSEIRGMRTHEEGLFPKFSYYLDESDPDLVILLRRQGGAFVAAFSARGATKEGIVEAAKEHYREVLAQNPWALGGKKASEEERSA